ncbi:leucine-rich repeat domain-containing protein [Coleofasciculus sp. E1-EBD-02]|jgi:internalin A|uniref:leucine-rich repeat domain-containing protein n=1 Tax=Coleofasciculus sp. E1-EBD-02 TaxID=3068481 RepID=UPI003302F09D
MNLNLLQLINNQITDINSLARLTNLEVLYLDYNQITDINPLSELTNLTMLFLEGNEISLDSSANAQPTCPVSPPDICKF